MKTCVYTLFCFLFLLLFTACGDDDKVVFPVESIALNKSALYLHVGDEVPLQVEILPEQATDKSVVWSSAHPEIAQVNEHGLVRAVGEGQTMVTVKAQDGGEEARCMVRVFPAGDSSKSRRLVLVYMAADNNLGQDPSYAGQVNFAKEDYKEMLKGMSFTNLGAEGFRLLVYKDWYSLKNPVLVELFSNIDGTVEETVIKTYDDRNSVGLAETREVFEDVFQNPDFEAESYGLVYWSHGDGWIPYPQTRWIGQDTGHGDNRMNISDFVSVLQSAPRFDFILFDACFMQGVEMGYELRPYANYLIGSPTETPGPGAPYDVILPYMFIEGEADALANAYYETYAAAYNGLVGSNTNWTGGVSIAAVDLLALEQLAELTKKGLATAADVPLSQLQSSVFNYDRRSSLSRGYVGYYDLQELMQQLLTEADFAAWMKAYQEALVFWKTTDENYSAFAGMFKMDKAHGVSHYIPTDLSGSAAKAYRQTAWYQAAGLSQLGW